MLISHPPTPREPGRDRPQHAGAQGHRVPAARRRAAAAAAAAAPRGRGARARPRRPLRRRPPPRQKDRISVGPPSDVRQKGPMILRREDDLTKVPKGEPTAAAVAGAAPAATPTPAPGRDGPEGRRGRREAGPRGPAAAARAARRQTPAGDEGREPLAGAHRPLDRGRRRRRHAARASASARGHPHGHRAEPGRALLRPPGRRLHALDQPLQGRGLPELDRPRRRRSSAPRGATSTSSSPSRGTDRCRRCGC